MRKSRSQLFNAVQQLEEILAEDKEVVLVFVDTETGEELGKSGDPKTDRTMDIVIRV